MNLFRKSVQFLSILLIIYALLTFALLVRADSFNSFLIMFVILTIIALIIAIIYSRTIALPLDKVYEFLKKISEDQHPESISLNNRDFKDLYLRLEKISTKLQYYEDKLNRHKKGFYTVIDSIQEAIWIQNEKGIIRTANESFEKLIGQGKIVGLYFWNIIRNKELYDFVDNIHKNPENLNRDIEFDGKYFLCSASLLEQTKEIVFILHDITDMKNLELMKKDLVLNVSHELRTPLTSIKGYIETLEQEVNPESKDYLDIIKRNTDRLINIVQDLLNLSKLEHAGRVEYEKISLKPFFDNLIKIFQQEIGKKKLDFRINIQPEADWIKADRYSLEQVFMNLIDNSIKHTQEGGIDLNIFLKDTEIVFEYSDTGSGIPAEHQNRIFERFYVVDKSRSRKTGSTGLGLSIVKHIINQHKGRIELESKLGYGTKFTIFLPQNMMK